MLAQGAAALTLLAIAIVPTAASAADPTPAECARASERALSSRKAGRLHDAGAALSVCTASSCPAEIRSECERRVAEVNAAMPSIVFDVKDAGGKDVADVRISIDGAPTHARAGAALTVDPGAHAFRFEAAGLPPREPTIVLRETEKNRHESIVLGTGSGASGGPPQLALVALGVGAAGLALGVAAGFVAAGKHSDLEGACSDASGTCPAAYANDLDAYHLWRTVSTIGYVVGALGVAGGAVLWITAPKPSQSGAAVYVWLGAGSTGIAGDF